MGIAYASPSLGCAIKAPILYIGAGLYLAYGVLFTKLFVDRYLRGKKPLRHHGGRQQYAGTQR